jgi:hypothetical protein
MIIESISLYFIHKYTKDTTYYYAVFVPSVIFSIILLLFALYLSYKTNMTEIAFSLLFPIPYIIYYFIINKSCSDEPNKFG